MKQIEYWIIGKLFVKALNEGMKKYPKKSLLQELDEVNKLRDEKSNL